MSSFERVALRIAVFAAGALLMALEVAAFRIIGKTFGSALRETTTVIAVFLAAMSVGYWAGGRAADRWPRPVTLVTALLAAAASLLVVPWVDAVISPRIAESTFALATHAFLATTVLFALPTVLLASTSPIAIRLFSTTTGHSGSTAGSISALSTVGSIAGSVATAFVLIDWLESISATVIFVAICTCATALLVVIAAPRTQNAPRFLSKPIAITAITAILFAVGAAAFVRSTNLDQALTADLPNTKTVFLADSAYHRIHVRDRGGAREMKFNVEVQTRMLLKDPNGPGLSYADSLHITPLLRPTRRVLILGLGGGTAVRQFSSFYPDVEIDAVEVDPMVVDAARRFFGLPEERLRIHIADARTFLARSREKWDLIIIDVYTTTRYGGTIPPHLTTVEFFRDVATHLNDGGTVHFHCAFAASRLMAALHRTLSSVFPSVLIMRGELLASRSPLIVDKEELIAKARRSPAARLPMLVDAISNLSDAPPAADAVLLTDDYAPVDTLLR